jgi:hypothetical protein
MKNYDEDFKIYIQKLVRKYFEMLIIINEVDYIHLALIEIVK